MVFQARDVRNEPLLPNQAKKTHPCYCLAAGGVRARRTESFCFFFSKKKRLLSIEN
jgi:hypothetical protein